MEVIMPTASGHTDAIQASRVLGAVVYNTNGERIGDIEDVILKKTSNGVMFAVVGFGGFLGIGEKYHALPWSSLDYDVEFDGYIVPFSKEELMNAPYYSLNEMIENDGVLARDQAFDYYGAQI